MLLTNPNTIQIKAIASSYIINKYSSRLTPTTINTPNNPLTYTVNYVDSGSTTIIINTGTFTSSFTTIVSTPSSGITRNIQSIIVKNNDVNNSNKFNIQVINSGTIISQFTQFIEAGGSVNLTSNLNYLTNYQAENSTTLHSRQIANTIF